MSDKPKIYDFDSEPGQQESTPKFPFEVQRPSSPKRAAWLIFSRLYVTKLNALMCTAPVGFRDTLEVDFEILCTKHRKNTIIFECDEDMMPRDIVPGDWNLIRENSGLIREMILRSSTMYPGTANSVGQEEAMIVATALGLESYSGLLPIKC